MKWGRAKLAFFLCFTASLLVVALRVRTLELRKLAREVHRLSLRLEPEKDALFQRVQVLRRKGELEKRLRAVLEDQRSRDMD